MRMQGLKTIEAGGEGCLNERTNVLEITQEYRQKLALTGQIRFVGRSIEIWHFEPTKLGPVIEISRLGLVTSGNTVFISKLTQESVQRAFRTLNGHSEFLARAAFSADDRVVD